MVFNDFKAGLGAFVLLNIGVKALDIYGLVVSRIDMSCDESLRYEGVCTTRAFKLLSRKEEISVSPSQPETIHVGRIQGSGGRGCAVS